MLPHTYMVLHIVILKNIIINAIVNHDCFFTVSQQSNTFNNIKS